MIRQFLAVSLAACSVAFAAPAPSWAVTEGDLKQAEIEFQLGGGGYGTFGDEKASDGSGGSMGKSTREKNLERDLKNEKDPAKRRAMTEELDRLRRDRQHDERENSAESKQAQAMEKQRLGEKGPQRVEATFIEGVLVRYTLSEE